MVEGARFSPLGMPAIMNYTALGPSVIGHLEALCPARKTKRRCARGIPANRQSVFDEFLVSLSNLEILNERRHLPLGHHPATACTESSSAANEPPRNQPSIVFVMRFRSVVVVVTTSASFS